jgi:hypothetical protein
MSDLLDNLTARIAEAEREGWHGEAEGLKISLAGAQDRLAEIDRRSAPAGPVTIGMPAFARVFEGAPAATSATPGDRP